MKNLGQVFHPNDISRKNNIFGKRVETSIRFVGGIISNKNARDKVRLKLIFGLIKVVD